jgi:hypothetical protein
MAKEWRNIDVDEILNYGEAHTGKMAQYERIMQHRMIKSVDILSDKLIGVMETIHKAHQGLKEKADELQKNYEKISKDQIESYKKISQSQSNLQKRIILLTVIIAISTVFYTGITAWSVLMMKKSNQIQSATVEAMQEGNKIQNKSLNVAIESLILEKSKLKKKK